MNILELITKINGYLLVLMMLTAFIHFAYLVIRNYLKKLPLAEDFTKKELVRVAKEYNQDKWKYLKISLKPFLIMILYIASICFYAFIWILSNTYLNLVLQ